MNITINDLNNYIVKFPTNYDYRLFKKYGITIKFPIIFCFDNPMEQNLNDASLLSKTILLFSMDKQFLLPSISIHDFQNTYTPIIFNKKYIENYNMFVIGKQSLKSSLTVWHLNVNHNFKVAIYNKIVKHYCELLFLCGEFIMVPDVKIYIVNFLL